MAVTTSNPVSGTVLIQYKHLTWTEPSLQPYNNQSHIGFLEFKPCYETIGV